MGLLDWIRRRSSHQVNPSVPSPIKNEKKWWSGIYHWIFSNKKSEGKNLQNSSVITSPVKGILRKGRANLGEEPAAAHTCEVAREAQESVDTFPERFHCSEPSKPYITWSAEVVYPAGAAAAATSESQEAQLEKGELCVPSLIEDRVEFHQQLKRVADEKIKKYERARDEAQQEADGYPRDISVQKRGKSRLNEYKQKAEAAVRMYDAAVKVARAESGFHLAAGCAEAPEIIGPLHASLQQAIEKKFGLPLPDFSLGDKRVTIRSTPKGFEVTEVLQWQVTLNGKKRKGKSTATFTIPHFHSVQEGEILNLKMLHFVPTERLIVQALLPALESERKLEPVPATLDPSPPRKALDLPEEPDWIGEAAAASAEAADASLEKSMEEIFAYHSKDSGADIVYHWSSLKPSMIYRDEARREVFSAQGYGNQARLKTHIHELLTVSSADAQKLQDLHRKIEETKARLVKAKSDEKRHGKFKTAYKRELEIWKSSLQQALDKKEQCLLDQQKAETAFIENPDDFMRDLDKRFADQALQEAIKEFDELTDRVEESPSCLARYQSLISQSVAEKASAQAALEELTKEKTKMEQRIPFNRAALLVGSDHVCVAIQNRVMELVREQFQGSPSLNVRIQPPVITIQKDGDVLKVEVKMNWEVFQLAKKIGGSTASCTFDLHPLERSCRPSNVNITTGLREPSSPSGTPGDR